MANAPSALAAALRGALAPALGPTDQPSRGFYIGSLFATGRQGAWYAPSDLATLTQDAAGTTPVTAVDQPVGRRLDKSGRGNHASQSTPGARPLFAAGSGEKFDGIDDHTLTAAGGGGSAGFFYCAVLKPNAVGLAQILWSDRNTGAFAGYRLRLTSGDKLELGAGNGTAFTTLATTASVALGVPVLLTAWDDGTNLNVQLNQGTVSSTARPAVAAGTAGFTEGRDNGASTGPLNGTLYDRVYCKDGGVTATERAAVQRALALQAGLAL